ncbi:Catalase HPII [compost metagenome]
MKVSLPADPPAQPKPSPALSQMNLLAGNIRSRKVAILIADGVSESDVNDLFDELDKEGAHAKLIAPSATPVAADSGASLVPDGTWDGLPSVAFDAVYVPGGAASSQAMSNDGHALHYLLEAYKHLKPLAFSGDAQALATQLSLAADPGLVLGATAMDVFAKFHQALAQHRIWQREAAIAKIPA